jgi:hypothetical protein
LRGIGGYVANISRYCCDYVTFLLRLCIASRVVANDSHLQRVFADFENVHGKFENEFALCVTYFENEFAPAKKSGAIF